MIAKDYYIDGVKAKAAYFNGIKIWPKGAPPQDYILGYDFNGNTTATGTGGYTSSEVGTISYATGRKGLANEAVNFTGQYIQTNQNIIWGDKVSVSMWMKTSETNEKVVIESNPDTNNYNGFSININGQTGSNTINSIDWNGGYNAYYTIRPVNQWFHLIITLDRSLNGIDSINIYINGELKSKTNFAQSNDLNGNFGSYPFYVGARVGNIGPYIGLLQEVKVYNRVLTQAEITDLYNN